MPNTITKQQEQELYSNVYKLGHVFVKSIRYDEKDFWAGFLIGVLEDKYLELGMLLDKIRVPLRKGEPKEFKVTKDGVVERSNYKQYTLEEKQGFSKKQAVSVVSMNNQYYPPVFGHDKDRREELVGVMFFSDKIEKDSKSPHILPSIMMSYDGGTVGRPYHFDSRAEAELYFTKKTQKGVWHSSVQSLIDFEKRNTSSQKKHNEILARLKWIDESKCQIGVFADNLKSRLIAQLRAADVKNNTGQKFVPISFYISTKESGEKIYPYYLEDQANDLDQALTDKSVSIEEKAIALCIYFLSNPENNQQAYNYLTGMLNDGEFRWNFQRLLFFRREKITECFRKVILNNIISILEAKHLNTVDVDDLQLKAFLLKAAIDLEYISKVDSLSDFISDYKNTALHFAAALGKEEVVRRLLLKPNINYNAVNDNNETVMFTAVECGNEEVVKLLLQKPDIDCNTPETAICGITPLLKAVNSGNKAIVELLLSNKTLEYNKANDNGQTALFVAVSNENEPIVKLLLQQPDIDCNQPDKITGDTSLLVAVKSGNEAIVELLLSNKNIECNQTDYLGNTPLCIASKGKSAEIFKLLLSNSNVDCCNKPNIRGETPLLLAVKGKNIEKVKLLLSIPKIDCNKSDDDNGITPLYEAVMSADKERKEDMEILELLLSDSRVDCNKATPLVQAIMFKDIEIVKLLLLNSRIDCNKANNSGTTPLFEAVGFEYIEKVKFLLSDPRIDCNKANNFGTTPLLEAVRLGNIEIVKLLLSDPRIDCNKANNFGTTPLLEAVSRGNIEVVKLLLSDPRIDCNKVDDNHDKTPIVAAIEFGNIEIVKLLLKKVHYNNSNPLTLSKRFIYYKAILSLKDKPEQLKAMTALLHEYKNQENDNVQPPKSPTLTPRM